MKLRLATDKELVTPCYALYQWSIVFVFSISIVHHYVAVQVSNNSNLQSVCAYMVYSGVHIIIIVILVYMYNSYFRLESRGWGSDDSPLILSTGWLM